MVLVHGCVALGHGLGDMNRLFAGPVQGRVQREVGRRINHHAILNAGGVMTIGHGGCAIG